MQSNKPPIVKHDLVEKAAALYSSNPVVWQAFLASLAVYTEQVREQVIQAPIVELPVAQGRAQSLSALLAVLQGAPSIAEKIRKYNEQV